MKSASGVREEPSAIGGYFELELPKGSGELHPGAVKFQSARAAFTSLLQYARPRRIWMPWYNCETLLEAPETARVEVMRYGINRDLYPTRLSGFSGDDCLLYVNYFGACSQQVERVLKHFPRDRVIIDNSQAFYAPASECLATLYSPRKFFGVPDGGYLVTRLPVLTPAERDEQSIDRLKPLLIRLAEGPEAGYAEVKRARLSLKKQTPKAMSALTETMLRRIDYPHALARRNENFMALHRDLGTINQFPLPADCPAGPLCYPLLPGVDGLHEWLIDHRVFVGRYWPDVRGPNGSECDLESILVRQCVPLPCDQRYDATDMERVIKLVRVFLEARGRL